MNFYFILVEPLLPENIGSCARAMKTMGFTNLRVVNSKRHFNERAAWLAHGSVDILRGAELFSTLNEAVKDIDIIIGTTARIRRIKKHYLAPEEVAEILKQKLRIVTSVGIVFGREDRGLLNREIELCDVVSHIPMKQKFPSLNLAQAVMIYAYALSRFTFERGEEEPEHAE